jgi:protein SCO1/2
MKSLLLFALMFLQTPQQPLTMLIGIDQNLGVQVDSNVTLRDEHGNEVRLGDFLGSRPVILMPVYYECPMLCSMQLNGLVAAMHVLPFTPGKEFEIVTFSIDPNETPDLALAKKEHYIRDYGRPNADRGWHFLTGNIEAIHKLTDSVGYRYTYDAPIRQWAHASALVVLTPAGRVSQYFFGIEYDPTDLKFSLIEASGGKIGSFIDHALLFCYQYDPSKGKYSLAIVRVIQAAGLATILGIVTFIIYAKRISPVS